MILIIIFYNAYIQIVSVVFHIYDIHSFITTIKGSDYILYTTMYLNILYINNLGVCAILNVLERHYTSFSVGKLI
jgi:hypothetical protein